MRGPTPRQLRFVAEYLVDLNATQAAIRAGYAAGKSAEVQGARLLRNARVSAAIEAARITLQIRTEVTQERVLAALGRLAFSDHTHYEVDDLGAIALAPHAPTGAEGAISIIKRRITTDRQGRVAREIELRFWDKLGPLKLAGRHVGLFSDRVGVSGQNGGAIRVAPGTAEDARRAIEVEARGLLKATGSES